MFSMMTHSMIQAQKRKPPGDTGGEKRREATQAAHVALGINIVEVELTCFITEVYRRLCPKWRRGSEGLAKLGPRCPISI
jgi:hypothetical protein